MSFKQWLTLIAAIACMWAIVPLMVLGGTGSWRRALQALRQYAGVMLMFVAVGGGIGLLMVAAQFIG